MNILKVVKFFVLILLCSPFFVSSLPIDSNESSIQNRRSNPDEDISEELMELPNGANKGSEKYAYHPWTLGPPW